MYADLGHLALVAALAFAAFAILTTWLGVRRDDPRLVISGRRAVYATSLLITVAMLALWALILGNDFSTEYVAGHSNRDLPLPYKIGSLWSGQQGSLLLWSWILGLYASASAFYAARRRDPLAPGAVMVTMSVAIFFLYLNNFSSNPFAQLAQISADGSTAAWMPADGRGLNPLLQHPAMVIHPPILYIGYIGFVVPFAFALSALGSGRLDSDWIHSIRRWTLFTWAFLGLGVMLGARWAYEELGWGGYWAWDPVENASLMPWLVGTAFLHSVVVQEKRSMLKIWNIVLVVLSFALCIIGTFLTRSGVVSSVHSFARSDIGIPFAIFITLMLTVSIGLILWRRPQLKDENRLDSMLSREAGFLFNNLLFVAMALSILFGTIYPIFSELLTGRNISVGQPYFNRIEVPLGLLLMALTGIGPLLAWRKTSTQSLQRNFILPTVLAVASVPLFLLAGIDKLIPVLSFTLCTFVTACTVQEFHRAAQVRRNQAGVAYPVALGQLLRRNSRRYGGYVVHLGVVLLFIGLTGAAFVQERRAAISPGETLEIGDWTLRLEGLQESENANYWSGTAKVAVYLDEERLGTMHPEKRFYFSSEQPSSEVAIAPAGSDDLYLVYAGLEEEGGKAVLQAYLNPLVQWVWWGGVVMAFGTIICMLPPPRKREVSV